MPAKAKAASQDPIRIKPSNKGKLHARLGVPQGQPIPAAKLRAAKKSPDPSLRKEATFAINARGFDHSKGGKPKATRANPGKAAKSKAKSQAR